MVLKAVFHLHVLYEDLQSVLIDMINVLECLRHYFQKCVYAIGKTYIMSIIIITCTKELSMFTQLLVFGTLYTECMK